MTIASVICEYNPFHTGHKHQLDYIRREINADYIICIMSGDFVQRGEPAIYSKELRTRWALENGADAVFFLPVCYSAASADLFAYGAISLLDRMGCVDYLCFGSECGDVEKLKECAEKLNGSGTIASPAIKELMKNGNTFPKSRSLLFPEYINILNSPNNVLAIEYLNALSRLKSGVKPFSLKREGQSYDDDTADLTSKYLSATAIRKSILEDSTDYLSKYVPYKVPKDVPAVSSNDFSKELYYALLLNKGIYEEYFEVNEDLAKRIENNLVNYKDYASFVELLKCKNFTHARISRALLHILLGIKEHYTELFKAINEADGVRLLGFKKTAEPLLKEITEKGSLQIITKVPAIYDELNDSTKRLLDMDLFASTLYDKVSGTDTQEYTKQLIII
ncbi:MAG: nucleotidyltransferase family protein [Lachnospiraceae bacterium]|nr:nucleotidyltransferase family protein [Lachnospiraceae bacterium]